MRTIYIDSDFKCHITDNGTMIPIETNFFDGKCDTFVEGYCYEIKENYTAIYPWKKYSELDTVQREYERQQLEKYKNEIIELKSQQTELITSYTEGINSI